MGTSDLHLVIDSQLENVSSVGTTVQQVCLQASLSETDAFQVQLAIVEALNNVIKHAYDNKPGNTVTVDIAVFPEKLVFTLIDQGKTNPGTLPKSLDFDPDDIDSIPESGMGLFIIQSVMDEIDCQMLDNKNVQTFVKYLAAK